ncbi:hypothetical protein N7475_003110 [Penicillium sp. IBT 31633x]|nr:hypothetical protein N7475_003110 [Penicillium sp. IBT 31633x]
MEWWSRDLGYSHADSHPVYSAPTLVTPGRAIMKWASTSFSPGMSTTFEVRLHSFLNFIILVWKTGLPVRSAVLKPHAGELVVGWVTTSESSLLYVFAFASAFLCFERGVSPFF